MKGIINLSNEDIKKELFDRAQFFFWAEWGAMGDNGAVEMIANDGRRYYCNFVYGDIDTKIIREACPLFGLDREIPQGWTYHYLGMGNHLYYRTKYDEEYCRLLGEPDDPEDNPGYEYQRWCDVAVKILGVPDDDDDDDDESPMPVAAPEDQTVFIAWKDDGSGLAGVIEGKNRVTYIDFAEGVDISAFYPVASLMKNENWVHKDFGEGKNIIVNKKHSDAFAKLAEGPRLLLWLLD